MTDKGAPTADEPTIADKSAILTARKQRTAEVEIPPFGLLKVRPLTRAEVLRIGEVADRKGIAHSEADMIATATVEPSFTIEEVKRWQNISDAGEMEPLTDKIQEISAMGPNAGKEATKRFPDGPES